VARIFSIFLYRRDLLLYIYIKNSWIENSYNIKNNIESLRWIRYMEKWKKTGIKKYKTIYYYYYYYYIGLYVVLKKIFYKMQLDIEQ